MTDHQIREAITHLKAIEELIPSSGGMITTVGHYGRRLSCVGDLAGLSRLSVAILKYALNARIPEGEDRAALAELDGILSSESPLNGLFIQMRTGLPPRKKEGTFEKFLGWFRVDGGGKGRRKRGHH